MKTTAALLALLLASCQSSTYQPLNHKPAPRISTYAWSKATGNFNNPFLAQ